MVKPELAHVDLARADHLDPLPGGEAGGASLADRLAGEVAAVCLVEPGDGEVPGGDSDR